tara:strand:+ start:187 stop:528 length:342 start_codon:yes stop_codon:yes gene_type:complete
MITKWNKDGVGIVEVWIPDRDGDGKIIDNSGVAGEFYEEYCFHRLRRERDKLLTESDWTGFSDSPLSDGKKIEWSTYRQELRDLPANSTPVLNYPRPMKTETILLGVTWPTKP